MSPSAQSELVRSAGQSDLVRMVGELHKQDVDLVIEWLEECGANPLSLVFGEPPMRYRAGARISVPALLLDVIYSILRTIRPRGRPRKPSTLAALRLLDQGISKEQIGKRIAAQYGGDPQNVTRGLRAKVARSRKFPTLKQKPPPKNMAEMFQRDFSNSGKYPRKK